MRDMQKQFQFTNLRIALSRTEGPAPNRTTPKSIRRTKMVTAGLGAWPEDKSKNCPAEENWSPPGGSKPEFASSMRTGFWRNNDFTYEIFTLVPLTAFGATVSIFKFRSENGSRLATDAGRYMTAT